MNNDEEKNKIALIDQYLTKFDLCETQHLAKELKTCKDLYILWDRVCSKYNKREIGKYELDELKDCIFDRMKAVNELESSINEAFVA